MTSRPYFHQEVSGILESCIVASARSRHPSFEFFIEPLMVHPLCTFLSDLLLTEGQISVSSVHVCEIEDRRVDIATSFARIPSRK